MSISNNTQSSINHYTPDVSNDSSLQHPDIANNDQHHHKNP